MDVLGKATIGPLVGRMLEARQADDLILDLVRQVKPHTNGECFLVLDSGAQVKVSRSYRDVVARFVH